MKPGPQKLTKRQAHVASSCDPPTGVIPFLRRRRRGAGMPKENQLSNSGPAATRTRIGPPPTGCLVVSLRPPIPRAPNQNNNVRNPAGCRQTVVILNEHGCTETRAHPTDGRPHNHASTSGRRLTRLAAGSDTLVVETIFFLNFFFSPRKTSLQARQRTNAAGGTFTRINTPTRSSTIHRHHPNRHTASHGPANLPMVENSGTAVRIRLPRRQLWRSEHSPGARRSGKGA